MIQLELRRMYTIKQLITSAIIAILILGSFLFVYNINKAYCWDCTPKRCYFDLDCGSGCWCNKDDFELDGDCVTE